MACNRIRLFSTLHRFFMSEVENNIRPLSDRAESTEVDMIDRFFCLRLSRLL